MKITNNMVKALIFTIEITFLVILRAEIAPAFKLITYQDDKLRSRSNLSNIMA